MPSNLFGKFLVFFGAICIAGTILLVPHFFAQGAWDGHYYDAGETLNPECAPTDVECDVNPVTDAAHGGTGLTTYSAGDLLYANSASSFGKLALGVDGKVLKVVAGVLTWADDTVGTAFTADGNGIELSGPTFSLELDGASLAKSADGLRLSATYAGQNTISTVGTITAGVWNGTAIADAFLTKSGDWTGTFDGLEGPAYAILAGQAGGQTLKGGTGSGENLILQSTANATKGKILFGASSAYDEDTLRLGVGTTTPVSPLQIASAVPATANNGLVSLGSGPFDGATSGFFTGSAAGTALAINTASGYAGDLINVQIAGSTRLNQAANGRMTITGTVGGTGVLYLANPSGGFAFGVDSAGGFAQPQTASKGMAFYNNAGTTYLKVGGSGGITGASDTLSGSDATSLLSLSQSWNTSGTPTALKLNISNTASNASSLLMDLQFDSVSQFKVTKAGAATFVGAVTSGGLASNSMSANNTGIVMKLRGGASTAAITGVSIDPLASSTITSGNHNTLDISANSIFAPTSGSATFSAFAISSEINQTGSASGISRGLYINPTMTAAADFRALEISNNSHFAIYQSGANAKNYFAGKVGIGAASPQQLLDASSTQPVLRLTNTTNLGGVAWAATEIGKIEFYSADASLPSVAASINIIGSADAAGGVAPGDMAFLTRNNAGLLTEKMRITDLGGVSIGTSAPGSYNLRLTGTRQAASGDLAVASFENAGTSSADVLTLKQTGEAGSSESAFINFYTSLGLVGTIASNGSGVTSYNTTSDRRLKDNIEDTEYGIDDVLKIPVREYTMRQDPKGLKQTGFIAQELAAIYPDAVSASSDDGISPLNGGSPWSIDYGRLTPLLVKSIQDQQGLLGAIADTDALDLALSDANNEQRLSAWEYISQKIQDDWRPLLNFAALRVTAIRGYFDEIFAKKIHTEELCVGTPGNETCLTKAQLDALLSGQSSAPAASQPSGNAEDGETPAGQNGIEAEPPAIEPSPPVEEIVP